MSHSCRQWAWCSDWPCCAIQAFIPAWSGVWPAASSSSWRARARLPRVCNWASLVAFNAARRSASPSTRARSSSPSTFSRACQAAPSAVSWAIRAGLREDSLGDMEHFLDRAEQAFGDVAGIDGVLPAGDGFLDAVHARAIDNRNRRQLGFQLLQLDCARAQADIRLLGVGGLVAF